MTNLVYFGSPAFSAEILKSILNLKSSGKARSRFARQISNLKCDVVGVVTTPDKLLGRKQVLTPSPVAQLAAKYDLPIFKPERLDEANLTHLKLLKPDVFLVVSYGKIIPKTWLTTPTIGTFNLHFSLLPKYRGALCISEAIKNQDACTGVTLMVMDEGMDTGPIISQEKVSIDINDNCETLTDKLTQGAIKLLNSQIPNLKSQMSYPQDETLASYTPTTKTRNRQSAFIPWSEIQPCLDKSQMSNILAKPDLASQDKSQMLHALIRSLNPDPGAWTIIGDLEVKIIKTSLVKSQMVIDLVQLPGKTPISWKQFQTRTNLPQNLI